MNTPIMVVAVDDDALVRRSLEISLKGVKEVRLLAIYSRAGEARDSLAGSTPDVLLWGTTNVVFKL